MSICQQLKCFFGCSQHEVSRDSMKSWGFFCLTLYKKIAAFHNFVVFQLKEEQEMVSYCFGASENGSPITKTT